MGRSKAMPGTERQFSGLKILGLDGPGHSMTIPQDSGDLQVTNWPPQTLRLGVCSGIWLPYSCGVDLFFLKLSLQSHPDILYPTLVKTVPGAGEFSPPKSFPSVHHCWADLYGYHAVLG